MFGYYLPIPYPLIPITLALCLPLEKLSHLRSWWERQSVDSPMSIADCSWKTAMGKFSQVAQAMGFIFETDGKTISASCWLTLKRWSWCMERTHREEIIRGRLLIWMLAPLDLLAISNASFTYTFHLWNLHGLSLGYSLLRAYTWEFSCFPKQPKELGWKESRIRRQVSFCWKHSSVSLQVWGESERDRVQSAHVHFWAFEDCVKP